MRKLPYRKYSHEVLKRVWARRGFVPLGGWPGRADTIAYDMWKYVDDPPRGRSYGLKTIKVRALPHSSHEMRVLKEDKNAWYGLPVSIQPTEKSKPPPPKSVQYLLDQSPYSRPVAPKAVKEKRTKMNRDDYLYTLGWAPTNVSSPTDLRDRETEGQRVSEGLLSRTPAPGRADGKPNESTHLAPSSVNQIQKASAKFQKLIAPTTDEPRPVAVRSRRRDLGGQSPSPLRELHEPPSTSSAEYFLSSGAQPISNSTRAPYTPDYYKKNKDSVAQLDYKRWSESPWGRLKTKAAQKLVHHRDTAVSELGRVDSATLPSLDDWSTPQSALAGAADSVASRAKVWPTYPRRHYSLRYTWLPQPLVESSVKALYDQDEGGIGGSGTETENGVATEKGTVHHIFSDAAVPLAGSENGRSGASSIDPRGSGSVASLDELERDYRAGDSDSYYSKESSLLTFKSRQVTRRAV
eukprot:gene227-232_t